MLRKSRTDLSTGEISRSRRFEDWPGRLNSILEGYQTRKFEWAQSDCGTLACDVVLGIIGIDLYSDFKNTYSNAKEYITLLDKKECKSISDLFALTAEENEIYEITPRLAFRGDIVSADTLEPAGHEALGVCVGANALFHNDYGLISCPMTKCSRAWGVS